jgi:hypothetical protein
LANDRFRVEYSPSLVTTDVILKAISDAGFAGRVVDAPAEVETETPASLDLNTLPVKLAEAFKLAAAESRHVLVDVHGPG